MSIRPTAAVAAEPEPEPKPEPMAARPARSSSRLEEVLQAGLRKLSLEQGETAVFAETAEQLKRATYKEEPGGQEAFGGVVQNLHDDAIYKMGFRYMYYENLLWIDAALGKNVMYFPQSNLVWDEDKKTWTPLNWVDHDWLDWQNSNFTPGWVERRPSAMRVDSEQLYPLIPGRAYVLPASPERKRTVFAEEYGHGKLGYAIGFLDDPKEYDTRKLMAIVRKMWEASTVTEFENAAAMDSFHFPLPPPDEDTPDPYTLSVNAWAKRVSSRFRVHAERQGQQPLRKENMYSNFWPFLRLKSVNSPADLTSGEHKEVYLCLGRWKVTRYDAVAQVDGQVLLSPSLQLKYPHCGFDDTYSELDRMSHSIAVGELNYHTNAALASA